MIDRYLVPFLYHEDIRIEKTYSALKWKEILIPAITWMNLEDIMLSESSQSQKDKYCMIPLI